MPRLVAIGEAMGELRQRGSDTLALDICGDVFNTLAYLRALGGDQWTLALLSRSGSDPISQRLLARCAELDIEPLLSTENGGALGLYLISTDDNGERSFCYWRANAPARRLVDCMPDGDRDALAQADYILLSGITLAILDPPQRETLETLVAACRRRGAKLVFDPNYRARLWRDVSEAREWIERFYRLCDIALPGVEDHQALFGAADAEAVLAHASLAGASEVVVKAGRAGVLARVDGTRLSAPFVEPERVVDTTAAGDAFNAGWLAARHAGLAPQARADFAARVAATVATHAGAIIPFALLPALTEITETRP